MPRRDIVSVGAMNSAANGKTRTLLKCAEMESLTSANPSAVTLALEYKVN